MEYLPVFLNLRDRLTLVVGGGAMAARKVELLLKAQARVRVVAPRLHPELALFRDAGRIEHLPLAFEPQHFSDVAFAIAATDSRAVNQAVASTGAARGVFVNVVDDAIGSSAVMPALVDRSPIIVAIGTAGQSPTLARRLRAQLEAMLPERLGELARWAGAVRERVRKGLPDADRRRHFWDQLFAGNLASLVLAGRVRDADQLLEQQLQHACADTLAGRGEVYLIGAGPGDPDLLTLRALQLMQQADVVLYDRLVSAAVLDRVRRDARRIDVGKQSGRHRVTQDRIHSLLLEHARQGLRVARLKGGDPFIFGRGGEEIDLLQRAGIPVIVVPGVTAALGAAASAQVPLTQRGLAPSVTFVTATGEGASELNWAALSAPSQTIVFYMGVAQLPRIVEHLHAHGAPADRPVAIVERATLPDQRVVAGSLGNIVEMAQRAQVAAPALLIVGEVASRAVQSAQQLPFQWMAGVART
ncbi:MAG TPA: siroheme synthase CysG [Steroidobacteraceae bacterium]|jgi:uroporphyrin-III C-methyltransferase/precorrin-2 dehydrogenase/sirohydrochlorin ferrochelatase|nr:siroheme synthase CysG [Steroidobacteraceae bacterium]